MSEYQFESIEKKWQAQWKENKTFRTPTDFSKPKYYVLDMFPYPSGAGLHVGHPLGYIATDIVSRYKRLKGYNVLHPMGYDSFGLPAEQYALQTGQHPAKTTEDNIATYRQQLDAIGFCFDWEKEVRTSDPKYYKWTQWIFLKLFNSWYNKETDKAESIETLIQFFDKEGNTKVKAACEANLPIFSAELWKAKTETEKHSILSDYRLAFISNLTVNWCPALGTVLANEEVKDGVSERGGYPVIKKEMPQWSLRITAYADRLIQDLDLVDWPEPVKEMQRNWIGKSKGCMVSFKIQEAPATTKTQGAEAITKIQETQNTIDVFTTRVDTLFGVTYLTLAPEHELVEKITTPTQKEKVAQYVNYARNRSERDRMSDVKTVSGEFTGAYAINPINNVLIPIWIGDYVLAGYGTGAVMAVPSSDVRDYAFAKHFDLPIILVQTGPKTDISQDDFDPKAGHMINSDFLNGLTVKEALEAATKKVEALGVGYGKINFRMRDAIFSRQRYWGEPIPIYYKNGLPYALPESTLPLVLPDVDQYKPTESGEPPLARAEDWYYRDGNEKYPLETNTMPGWAGSSWYFLRYMDANNPEAFVSQEALDYWQDVDLYLGGSEHATGHLLYSRFWHKFLNDLGYVKTKEYAKKLINQGMIVGRSNLIYRLMYDTTSTLNDPNQPSNFKIPEIYIDYNVYLELSSEASENKLFNDIALQKRWENFLEKYIAHCKKEFKLKDFKVILHNYKGLTYARNVHINYVDDGDILNKKEFQKSTEYNDCWFFEKTEGTYVCGSLIEKMSKSKLNVVNPNDVIEKYGADTLRLYEMFLGPLEMSKPWSTSSISGVSRFLRNLWRLFYSDAGQYLVVNEERNKAELKTLHKTIKKVEDDIEGFSFNTSVSTFMICVNELSALKCHKKSILEALLQLMAPYAPHITEELWEKLGHTTSIMDSKFPTYIEAYTKDSSFEYPISFNGKVKMKLEFSVDMIPADIEKEVLAHLDVQKYLEGKAPKKVIVVPNKIVNLVV